MVDGRSSNGAARRLAIGVGVGGLFGMVFGAAIGGDLSVFLGAFVGALAGFVGAGLMGRYNSPNLDQDGGSSDGGAD